MKLISMELTGFRNYKEKHFFSFGVAANQILGDRGKGKTALGEAILWCLRGCDLQGNTTGIQKRLKNRGSKEIRVETQWDIEEPNGSTRRHSFWDWEKELSSLGNQYRELVREWKEINKKPLPHATNIQSAAHDRQAELDRISAQCQMVLDHGFALKKRIQSERKRFEEDQADFLGQKDYELQQLRNEIHRLEVKKNLRRSNELRAEGLARLHKQFDEGIVERERIQAEIQSVHNFMLEYARKQVETANRELTLAEILLTSKRDAEGSITLRYKLLYDKKEYFSLSSSEKIRCSFELSHLAHKILGRRIPVFIDTGESIEAFMDAKTQFFVTSVVPHATLSCDVVVA